MMLVLRLLVVLAWIPAQLIGVMLLGWGLVGMQTGHRGEGLLTVALAIAPVIVAGGALLLSFRTDPGTAKLLLGGATALLVLGVALLALTAGR